MITRGTFWICLLLIGVTFLGRDYARAMPISGSSEASDNNDNGSSVPDGSGEDDGQGGSDSRSGQAVATLASLEGTTGFNANSPHCYTGTRRSDPSTNKNYLECVFGKYQIRSCAPGTIFCSPSVGCCRRKSGHVYRPSSTGTTPQNIYNQQGVGGLHGLNYGFNAGINHLSNLPGLGGLGYGGLLNPFLQAGLLQGGLFPGANFLPIFQPGSLVASQGNLNTGSLVMDSNGNQVVADANGNPVVINGFGVRSEEGTPIAIASQEVGTSDETGADTSNPVGSEENTDATAESSTEGNESAGDENSETMEDLTIMEATTINTDDSEESTSNDDSKSNADDAVESAEEKESSDENNTANAAMVDDSDVTDDHEESEDSATTSDPSLPTTTGPPPEDTGMPDTMTMLMDMLKAGDMEGAMSMMTIINSGETDNIQTLTGDTEIEEGNELTSDNESLEDESGETEDQNSEQQDDDQDVGEDDAVLTETDPASSEPNLMGGMTPEMMMMMMPMSMSQDMGQMEEQPNMGMPMTMPMPSPPLMGVMSDTEPSSENRVGEGVVIAIEEPETPQEATDVLKPSMASVGNTGETSASENIIKIGGKKFKINIIVDVHKKRRRRK